MRHVLALGQLGEVDTTLIEPVPPRLQFGEVVLDLVVLDEATHLGVDEEHLAGAQASLADDGGWVEARDADLGAEDDEAVGGLHEPARAQTVAVEGRAHVAAVGEGHGCRPIPRLHDERVVLVEVTDLGTQVFRRLPSGRDHHVHGVRERASRERKELKHLVERCGVARALRDDREQI